MSPAEVLHQRVRPLSELPLLAEKAAGMLSRPKAPVHLTLAEARQVVARMGLVSFPAAATLLREGAESASGHMLLLLEGEVSVDSEAAGSTEAPLALSVVGPGEIIGEMALLDGAPRAVSCTAVSAVQAAGLSRKGLEELMAEHPVVAAKLVVVLATRIADRLRAVSQQVQLYAQLAAERNEELRRIRSAVGPGSAR
ncbi:MAG: cyclic nucleotide-binding domain-containing protein [Rubrivivax sp.]|nr:cyclic nucleotide-binding domain-containing protein [Rubrivivax sp.]